MAPTESQILSDFLLPPAPLPSTLTLPQFRALFPRSLQQSTQIKSLYLELAHQRAIDIDDVKKNIAAECKRGTRLRRQVAAARRQSVSRELEGLDERDLVIEAELNQNLDFDLGSRGVTSVPHDLETVLPAMDDAILNLRVEIRDLEREIRQSIEAAETTIGDLSDLRYGKFNALPGVTGDVVEEAREGLRHVQGLLGDTGHS